MDTIYRVQNDNGCGPYGASATGVTSQDWARPDDPFHSSKPCPDEDGIERFPEGWVCAFSHLGQLFQWFTTNEVKNLKKLGFNIWEIDISETHEEELS